MSANATRSTRTFSRFRTIEGRNYKTCPACTTREGREVYHRLEHFGERQVAPGVFIHQSWCRPCRSASNGGAA